MNLSEVRFFGQFLANGKAKAKLPPDGLQNLLAHLTNHRARNPEALLPADVPFARPWAGKGMRTFVPTSKINQGEVVELAKHFDAQWHCPFWTEEDPVLWDNDFYGKLTKQLVQWAGLQELSKNDYDASEIVFDPVAIHYSHASIRSATTVGLAEEQKQHRQALFAALRELGVQPRFITSEAIEKGELSRLGIKVLFLPMSLSLSEGEVRELVASECAMLRFAD